MNQYETIREQIRESLRPYSGITNCLPYVGHFAEFIRWNSDRKTGYKLWGKSFIFVDSKIRLIILVL
jgi:hypothetical protein